MRLGSLLRVATTVRNARAMTSAVTPSARLDTLIFDIDDTLYPVSARFSEHRNGPVVAKFMCEQLGFESEREALELRDEMFREHHSTLKGLAVASAAGRTPKPFEEKSLGAYWAAHCDFAGYLPPNDALRKHLFELKALGYELVVFTNAPRAYGLRCLESLNVRDAFADDRVFGVEDVMPHCKPEPEAFQKVLDSVGAAAETSVMFEDSMKNVRACKALGMRTVFVDEGCAGGEAGLLGDAQTGEDVGVIDATVARIADIKSGAPWLWERRAP
mmetsp:Transcript_8901/g.27835  ORF Transcript_8901/g.27835 Transcript_8901/m.27835 type:complete len:273 (+) Transcript_8901:182-1000(+)